MANKSVMVHSFSEVPRADIPRSTFNRSHGHKTTFDADYLVPVLVDDVIPGDTFRVNMSFFARLATPIYPIMDNIYLESFFFFVPYRLVWQNWEKFCGAQDDPADSIDFTVPTFSGPQTIQTGDRGDYMGLPINVSMGTGQTVEPSVLPFRAYNLIWNEWFRDQNLQDSQAVPVDDGPDSNAELGFTSVPLKRGKRHDYFTSCLPWPQKGDAVSLPLGTSAPITGIGFNGSDTTAASGTMRDATGNDSYAYAAGLTSASPGIVLEADGTGATSNPTIAADLSSATAATINELRLAFQTQRLLERDARSGTRYNETILAHYGVTVPDFRIQRPEFLGGGSSPVNMTPVPNTSADGTNNQGDLSAFGTASGTHGFTKSFTEHGVIIGLINARADITYSQGLERYWAKSTRYDFYYPVLSQIGEQSVLNSEIYLTNTTTDDDVFGYQERYAEYRYKPSIISGVFKPQATASLESWHLSEEFTSLPTLGDTFIQSNTGGPLDRAIAVSTEPHFICDMYFDMKCARPMPLFGVPGNLDHF